MARLRPMYTVNIQLRDSIEAEIKKEYGCYLSAAQVGKYLNYSKPKYTKICEEIPNYPDQFSGRKRYRAVDIAEYLARQRVGTA